MKRGFAAVLLAGALAAPFAVRAQALPDVIRAAGVTVIQWQGVLAEVHRSAREKHVSERALAVVCTKMGVQLAKDRHFDLNQLISLIGGRADEINALYQQLALEEQRNNPAAGNLLRQARAAMDVGDLDQADALLKQASLETLAVVAYRQPVSRARISAIRGVNIDGVIRTLLSGGFIEECGTDAESGALLYRTTWYFLERLGLTSLEELPPLAPYLPDIESLDPDSVSSSG